MGSLRRPSAKLTTHVSQQEAKKDVSLCRLKEVKLWISGPSCLLQGSSSPSYNSMQPSIHDHHTSFPANKKSEILSRWAWNRTEFYWTNSYEKMVLPRFSRSLDWWLIIEFCFLRVSGFELIFCWIVNRRTALSTTYFACLLVVCRERGRRSPKLLSSCSGIIDFKQNNLYVSGRWTVIPW